MVKIDPIKYKESKYNDK